MATVSVAGEPRAAELWSEEAAAAFVPRSARRIGRSDENAALRGWDDDVEFAVA